MPEPNMLALSRLMTDLVNTTVTFKPARAVVLPSAGQMYGTYNIVPENIALVVQADLTLLSSLAASLTGTPNSAIAEHMSPMSELMRDAIHEILNISSTAVVAEGRAVFQSMTVERAGVEGAAGVVLRAPHHSTFFDVTVDQFRGGRFTIFSASLL